MISLLAPVCKSLFVLWFGRHPLELICNLTSLLYLHFSLVVHWNMVILSLELVVQVDPVQANG